MQKLYIVLNVALLTGIAANVQADSWLQRRKVQVQKTWQKAKAQPKKLWHKVRGTTVELQEEPVYATMPVPRPPALPAMPVQAVKAAPVAQQEPTIAEQAMAQRGKLKKVDPSQQRIAEAPILSTPEDATAEKYVGAMSGKQALENVKKRGLIDFPSDAEEAAIKRDGLWEEYEEWMATAEMPEPTISDVFAPKQTLEHSAAQSKIGAAAGRTRRPPSRRPRSVRAQ